MQIKTDRIKTCDRWWLQIFYTKLHLNYSSIFCIHHFGMREYQDAKWLWACVFSNVLFYNFKLIKKVDCRDDELFLKVIKILTITFVLQVAVTPVLYSTTDAARSRFSPIERGCYFEGELSLAYLPKVSNNLLQLYFLLKYLLLMGKYMRPKNSIFWTYRAYIDMV